MIHPAVRKAVGWLSIEGELKGHAVLIGPRLAVTCAHVLSMQDAKPEGQFELNFPNQDLTVMAEVVAWAPYAQTLTPRSDIAVLKFNCERPTEEMIWVRLESARPDRDRELAALEYLLRRCDGDTRRCKIHDRFGAVLSISGDYVLEPGMSGTGLFYPEHGERLLGLMSGRRYSTGQIAGYAIPAEYIAALIDSFPRSELSSDQRKFAFDTDENARRFANTRVASFDLLAPSQTAVPGGGVALQAALSFGGQSPGKYANF